ncbi:TM0106 family RecB-like putative nuclease [Corynebacterium pseudodiphtheriticum]|uniref:TM0106 family RecB-like putative nuclease n=1 Tax=Corynebacterium pseudodiphtheriticum TaxID=37637 RepID=UPI002542B77F|nr:TM0106 family RecB-like putative nuclease [Corynebacterium pseudodiphtheriticum]MDK4242098.1 TM0106 family RecB-like putative nuclease [Corynebacterium pseudodiphtheriticum]
MIGRRDFVEAHDLVGCHYRLVQARRYPETLATEASQERALRSADARAEVAALLPVAPALGDGRRRNFRRIDLGPLPAGDAASVERREFDTLEALAWQPDLVTGAVLAGTTGNPETGDTAGGMGMPGGAAIPHIGQACKDGNTPVEWKVSVDALVRTGDNAYLPVMVSNHRVAREKAGGAVAVVPTHRAGLGRPITEEFALRQHSVDGYRLGLAARALEELGLATGRGGLIGQDRRRIFLMDTQRFQRGLSNALAAVQPEELPQGPRRRKECASCRFWVYCEQELQATDDISLFLSGDRADHLRERGITTVEALRRADPAVAGDYAQLADAWRRGIAFLARRPAEEMRIPRADVELDIDMEAYLDQGAYLWGVWDGVDYHPFVTWDELGGAAEARNFAKFWEYLCQRRRQAESAGQSFRAYCYSAHGENHWMRMSVRRFAGQPGIPSMEEVSAFIASEQWVDVFRYAKQFLADTAGMGLKQVAATAGHRWPDEDVDGEQSVNARRIAVGDGPEATGSRAQLLGYNQGDCQATRVVRDWLCAGAPGVPRIRSVR